MDFGALLDYHGDYTVAMLFVKMLKRHQEGNFPMTGDEIYYAKQKLREYISAEKENHMEKYEAVSIADAAKDIKDL